MMPPLRRIARMVAVLVIALGGASRSDAQSPGTAPGIAADSQLEARTRALSAELRCPVCQGISIEDSPAALAKDMRAVVREQLRSGRSPEQVKAFFVGRYGEWILLRPAARGFNWLVYLLPWLALLGGGGALALMIRRWRRAPVPRSSLEAKARR